jgi:hypothetical protein
MSGLGAAQRVGQVRHGAEGQCDQRQRLRSRRRGPPAFKIAIVTCADPRLTSIEQMLGLAAADVDMIRNFGTVIDDDRAGADCACQVLQLHRRRGEHQGADPEGQVTSVDLAGRSGQGFVFDVLTGRLSEVFPD